MRIPAAVDVALHVIVTRSGGCRRRRSAKVRSASHAPLILAAYGEPNGIVETGLKVGAADVLVLPQPIETLVVRVAKGGASRTASRRDSGKVVTVFSPKGGSGKTVLATNLARRGSALRSSDRAPVDLDLQFGDAALTLAVPPRATIADLAASQRRHRRRQAEGVRLHRRPFVSGRAGRTEAAGGSTGGRSSVSWLAFSTRRGRRMAPWSSTRAHCSTPQCWRPWTATDRLLLVCNPEVTSLKNVRIGLETIDRLGFPRDRVSSSSPTGSAPPGGVTFEEIEHALDATISFELPDDPVCTGGDQPGHTRALSDPGSRFSRAVTSVAKTVFAAGACRGRAADEGRTTFATARSAMTRHRGQRFHTEHPTTSVLAERLERRFGKLKARARDPHAELKSEDPSRVHRTAGCRLPESREHPTSSRRGFGSWSTSSSPPKTHRSARASAHAWSGRSPTTFSATDRLEPFLARIRASPRSWSTATTSSTSSVTAGSRRRKPRFSTTRTFFASSTGSCRRSVAASTRRRRWSTLGFRTGVASTRSFRRWHCAGPSLTIRKFAGNALSLPDLIGLGTLSGAGGGLSRVQCVRGKLNILISGGTGTGKTTLLNAVSSHRAVDGANRDGRGRSRASTAAAARRLARVATAEHRGRRRGANSRPRPERATHAARSHHRRRGSWRQRRSTCCRR